MSEYNYFVTAQRPTVVTHALGPLRFTSPKPADLVVVRASRLEVFRALPSDSGGAGLETVCDLPVHGRVAVLEPVRASGDQRRDLLLLCTEKQQFVVLRYNVDAARIDTVAAGSLRDATGRPVDHPPLCTCDPGGRAAVVYLYEGLLKVIGFSELMLQGGSTGVNGSVDLGEPAANTGGGHHVFSTRVAEPRVLDVAFLHSASGENRPLLGVLHADGQGSRFLSAWAVDLKAHNLLPGAADRDANLPVKLGSSKLEAVPPPFGGALVLGGGTIAYHDEAGRHIAGVSGGPRSIAAVACADEDGSRWLVGSTDGGLWLLRLQAGTSGNAMLTVEHLGVTSPACALVHLGDSRAFVGSLVGDSQLLRLSANRAADGNHFTIEDTWTNLGPILDFCVADVDERGQNQIVTCSGIGRTGALRCVRIGIGVNEVGSLDGFEGVLGVWALGGKSGDGNGAGTSAKLVFSFVGGTSVLALTNDASELVEYSAPGFACEEDTLFCCAIAGVALQVTRACVRAASLDALTPLARWAPQSGARIQSATEACGGGGVLVSLSNGDLLLLHVEVTSSSQAASVSVAAAVRLDGEVACLSAKGGLCAVGLWTRRLQVLQLQSSELDIVYAEALPNETIPRSAIFARLGDVLHLIVGMGDGRLVSFHVDEKTGALSRRKAVHLGAQPIRLLSFRSGPKGGEYVFATGDRPMIVHAHTPAPGQLAYAAVNIRQVSHVAHFDAAPFTGCLAFITERRLMIGSFDDIQRVHVRTVHLGESPHRISYQRQASVIAVGCHPSLSEEGAGASVPPASGSGTAASSCSSSSVVPAPPDMEMDGAISLASLHFVDGRTLQISQTLRMEPHEQVASMAPVIFEGSATEYLAVGTAYVFPDEPEPLRGRILLYEQQPGLVVGGAGVFRLAAELDVPGAVYALLSFQGMLLGSVNNRVSLWRWSSNGLDTVCCHSTNILALYLQVLGDHVLLGDLMRSASLLQYKPGDEPELAEVARDLGSAWLTSTAMLSERLFLCTDDTHNVFTLSSNNLSNVSRTPAGVADDARGKLERVGQMHTGEFVNRMHRAPLVEHPAATADGADASSTGAHDGFNYSPIEQIVWASVDGSIGLIASLRGEHEFARLSLMQDAVSKEVLALGGLSHREWRDHWSEQQGSSPHKGFIDGNLLELALEMPRQRQQAVVDRLRAGNVLIGGVEGLLREIEELAQVH